MKNSYQRIASIILYVLFAIGVIVAVLFYVGGNVEGTADSGYPEPKITDNALYLSYVYFIITTVLAVVLPLMFRPQSKGRSGLYLAIGFVVVMLISWVIGSGEPMKDITMSATAMRLIDGGLISCYILLGIAFIGIVYSELSGFFR